MRGNRQATPAALPPPRSIPAYAGEPAARAISCHFCKVYPRVCGGTIDSLAEFFAGFGLSPRMRGNRRERGRCRLCCGSIPAYAGEPDPDLLPPLVSAVYPRVCGGTCVGGVARERARGLSPRMRGNLIVVINEASPQGSIPAYAGEPPCRRARCCTSSVYPRVCGGTEPLSEPLSEPLGLSPRMRGNLPAFSRVPPLGGSIPAYAGEPRATPPSAMTTTVYPRVCGGTSGSLRSFQRGVGLSPRMRGNLRPGQGSGSHFGSIPAYAGEPVKFFGPVVLREVYPRVCGGTGAKPGCRQPLPGLSPRMRGNLSGHRHRHRQYRSIPAYAGEPEPGPDHVRGHQVYPRVCGGTAGERPQSAD